MLFNPAVAFVPFFLAWLASCSEQPIATMDINSIQLTKESLDDFTARLTGGSTDSDSVGPPEDLTAEKLDVKLWMKYIIGSAAVLGSVDGRALSVMHELWNDNEIYYLPDMLEELAKKNDLDTVAHFIAKNTGQRLWNTVFGDFVIELAKEDWNVMRRLSVKILSILRESKDKSIVYSAAVRRTPIGFQYERISSRQVPLDEIDRVYLYDEPPYSLLREIFFQARCSDDPNPAIRKYVVERVPWFKQFMPKDIPGKAKNTSISMIIEPAHDVWVHICSFMDAETLIFVWPLVCRSWNKSYFKILAEETKVQEWFLRDLSHVSWSRIHKIAPWKHFLGENNSAAYLGQCIINGALRRVKLSSESREEVKRYIYRAMMSETPFSKTDKKSTLCGSFAKLIEEGYEIHLYGMPTLFKPPFLTDEEYEKVIRHLIYERKLVVKISCQWIIDNISRIYSILGEDQALIEQVIDLSADSDREPLFIWIMIGQACGMTEETARLIFDKPGIFTEKFLRPVVVKPSEYYDFIAESGMLFEMLKYHYEYTLGFCSTYGLYHLVISLILSFKYKPDKIDKIVASMTSQLPTLCEDMLRWMKNLLGTGTSNISKKSDKCPLEDVEFVKRVLTRCGLLDESGIWLGQ